VFLSTVDLLDPDDEFRDRIMSALSVPCLPVVAGRLTGPGRRIIAIAETRIKARRHLESPTHPRPALNFLLLHLQQSYQLDRPASRQNINCQGQFLDSRS